MKVLITRRIDAAAVAIIAGACDVEYVPENRPLPRTYLLERLRHFDGVLGTVSESFDAEVLNRSQPSLKAISNMAAGLDNIDLASAAALGIRVFNVPETTVDATADHTLALALALLRRVVPARQFILDGQWRAWDPELFLGRTISGLVWGICGFGRIGQAVARRAHGFGATIAYHDPQVAIQWLDGRIEARRVTLDALLSESDVLSIHVPLSDGTTRLVGRQQIAVMKPGAILVNMARGSVVDSAALAEALGTGRLAGAALDVFDPEPIAGNHAILGFDNLVMTPHIGTATVECRREMAVRAARNLVDYLAEAPR